MRIPDCSLSPRPATHWFSPSYLAWGGGAGGSASDWAIRGPRRETPGRYGPGRGGGGRPADSRASGR
ncbi:hypothetical protein GCM10010324_18590 [Streptomyces hiroshimensis]|uniref:Uncharacterized protein n=1 Tax=Streptomyces hiroshimensis TaxID=66424 RepID=A0ABQ2Y816_9ACTN|nr:hypothetical protein GCM10010324_18590 [Streptomyces hiroshimensis]